MKKLNFYLMSLLVSFAFILSSCGGSQTPADVAVETVQEVAINEAQVLVDYFEANGNFINSKNVPAMVKSKEVHANLENPKYLVIDLRKEKDFKKGHIANADNIKMKDLILYFENDINPADYDKIAMVCYTGQTASFSTSVLRLLGYNNVYAMKWGMSSWAKPFSEKWMTKLTNDFVDQVVTEVGTKAVSGDLPILTTGQTEAKAILKMRAKEVLNTAFKSTLVKAPELFENGNAYYINNYWPMSKYETGHIPGAIQYQPKKSLDTKVDLLTLPTDKKVVTYCFTGQHSAFVTAYLRLLGYDAYSLAFGANSFMNDVMVENGKGWHGFSEKLVHDYEIVEEAMAEGEFEDGEEEDSSCG